MIVRERVSYGFEWPVVICVTRLRDERDRRWTTLYSSRAISTLIVAEIKDDETTQQAYDKERNNDETTQQANYEAKNKSKRCISS